MAIDDTGDGGDQQAARSYYDRFARYYDWISSEAYYRKPRHYAVEQLALRPGHTVLNVPCGTGQNLAHLEAGVGDTGRIIGVDISAGMLARAQAKVASNGWTNVELFEADVATLDSVWIDGNVEPNLRFDAILCDLGLSGFPSWQGIIDNLLSLLKPRGRLVIMDWFIDKPTLRGRFICWIGKGEVDRPLYQYLNDRVDHFVLDNTFKSGQMFVATGWNNS